MASLIELTMHLGFDQLNQCKLNMNTNQWQNSAALL